jgi:hypothetical protein
MGVFERKTMLSPQQEFEKQAAIAAGIKNKIGREMTFEDVPAYVREMQIVLVADLMNEVEKEVLTLSQVIKRMKASGMDKSEIANVLLNDLHGGGQLFGDFRKQLKATVKHGIEEHARKEVENNLDADMWDWLGIVDGSICHECLRRHNLPPHDWDYWVKIGLPGTGATPCDKNCRCVLMPTGNIEKTPGGFIHKGKKEKKKKIVKSEIDKKLEQAAIEILNELDYEIPNVREKLMSDDWQEVTQTIFKIGKDIMFRSNFKSLVEKKMKELGILKTSFRNSILPVYIKWFKKTERIEFGHMLLDIASRKYNRKIIFTNEFIDDIKEKLTKFKEALVNIYKNADIFFKNKPLEKHDQVYHLMKELNKLILKKMGIENEFYVYRGLSDEFLKTIGMKKIKKGYKGKMFTNAIESYSLSKHVAEQYAKLYTKKGLVIKTKVNIDDIFFSGLYDSDFAMAEMVVLGGEREFEVVWTNIK